MAVHFTKTAKTVFFRKFKDIILEFFFLCFLEKSALVFLLNISLLDPHIFHETLDVLESHGIKTGTDSFHILSLFREGF